MFPFITIQLALFFVFFSGWNKFIPLKYKMAGAPTKQIYPSIHPSMSVLLLLTKNKTSVS